jgi:hypothetical protein
MGFRSDFIGFCAVLVTALSACAGFAQDAPKAVSAKGAVVRWLDKVSGITGDLDLSRGQSGTAGRLTIQLDECRYPEDGTGVDAYAHLTIMDRLAKDPVFSGWMLATAPALSALDHPRYDVWVLSCITE